MSSGASKVIVLEPDPRAGRLIQLGFEREGVPVLVPPLANGSVDLPELAEPPGLVLVGGGDSATAVDVVRRTRAWLAAKAADVPIVVASRAPARSELAAAGADEVIARPVFLRDIVTIGRLLRGVPRDQRDHLAGSLVETTGVLTLVRALSALGRSAVLTLIRGLRRGEVRFFHGEVTSAQVGLIHGQAAFHQLLLWTDARFEFAHEDIVRRQQIPMSPEELFADAEQFLEGVREHAGQLSPSTVLEQNVQRVQQFGKQVPTEVHGILRMFDGHRVLADILEDSPYRVFETLRVTQKAVEIGLLRVVNAQRPKATWRAVLAIEEWLVGNETRDAVAERIANLDSGPVKAPPKKTKHKRKRRGPKKKESQPPPNELKGDIDWGALVPRMIGAELGPISGVVPSYEAHGEVELPTRDKPREGLEALMDTAKRQKIFPTDIGLEPSVVIAAEPSDDVDEWERAEWRAKQVALAQEKAVAEAKAAAERADAEQRADAERRAAAEQRAEAERRAAAEAAADPRHESDGAHADSNADTAAPAPRRKRAAVERGEDVILEPAVPTPSEPTNTARHVAPPPPAASDLAGALAAAAASIASEPVPSPAQPAASNTDRHVAPPPASAATSATPIAAAATAPNRANETSRHSVPLRPPAQSPASGGDAPAGVRPPTNGTTASAGEPVVPSSAGGADEIDPAAAGLVAVPTYVAPTKSDPAAAVSAVPADTTEPRQIRPGATDARELVRDLVADVVPPTEATDVAAEATDVATNARTAEPATVAETPAPSPADAPAPSPADAPAPSPADAPAAAGDTASPITTSPIINAPAAPASGSIDAAHASAAHVAAPIEPAFLAKSAAAASTSAPAIESTAPAARDQAAPEATEDEPSDGVIRATIASADTARVSRARMRPPTPEHDGPPVKQAKGEISQPTQQPAAEPAVSEPSILVADLAAVHEAAAAVATKPAPTPPPADAATPSRELEVAEVRRDALAFSEAEEAFFRGAEKTGTVTKVETFDDLDEGYQPPGFWDRVFGRKKPK